MDMSLLDMGDEMREGLLWRGDLFVFRRKGKSE